MQYVTGSGVNVPASGSAEGFVDCPSPKRLVAGGGLVSDSSAIGLVNPTPSATRWVVTGWSYGGAGTMTPIAVCM